MREFQTVATLKTERSPRWRRASLGLLLALLLVLLTACASNTGLLGGGSWQASGLAQENLQVLAVNPNHAQDVYAGDAHNGIFASTDAGVTWKASSVGLPVPVVVNALSFDVPGKKLYAATSAALFVSTDSAASWSRVMGLPVDSYSSLSFDVNTPQVVYVASQHSGLLMSSDSGGHWTKISAGLPAGPLTSVLYDANQKVLWTAMASALYRSSNQGTSWSAANTGLPANVGINVLAAGPILSNGNDLIFAGTNHGFFITNDSGQHWSQSQSSLASLKINAILLDANQASEVYASTNIGVLRSTDSGQNWNQVASGLPNHTMFNGLAQCDVNYTQLLVASGGIYRYPGSGSVLDPSRFIPILLIILFFGLLYYFFGIRRRRVIRRRTSDGEAGRDADTSRNGRYPPTGRAPGAEEDEKKER